MIRDIKKHIYIYVEVARWHVRWLLCFLQRMETLQASLLSFVQEFEAGRLKKYLQSEAWQMKATRPLQETARWEDLFQSKNI